MILWCSCILLLLQGCSPAGNKKTASGTCATYDQAFDVIAGSNVSDTVRARQLHSLYDTLPLPCRSPLAKALTGELLALIYTNQAADTGIAGFLQEMSSAAYLTRTARLWARLRLANYYCLILHNPVSAEKYAILAARDSSAFNDSLSLAYHTVSAQINFDQSKFREAAQNYVRAIGLSEHLNDQQSLARLYSNFATLYNAMGNAPQAIALRKKALAAYRANGWQDGGYVASINLGADYADLNNADSAKKYYWEALSYLDSGVNNPMATFNLYLNIGNMYSYFARADSALWYMDKAKSILAHRNNPSEAMVFDLVSAKAYALVLKDVSPLMRRIEGHIPDLAQQGDVLHIRDCYASLSLIAELKKDYEHAYTYRLRMDSIETKLSSEENKKTIADLEAKYQNNRKELQIALQQKELDHKGNMNTLLLGGLTLLLLGGGFIASRTQLRRRRQEVTRQQLFTTQLLQRTEDERTRIARDLHDGITQELLLMKHDIGRGITDVSQKADQIIQEIRMLSRNLRPTMLDTVGLEKSIEHLCHRIMEQQQVFLTCELHYPVHLARQDELQLFRIIQEAVNNIVKYAGAEAARITLSGQEGQLVAEIRDNGRGFNVRETLLSGAAFGLQSIIERAKALNGKATITSSPAGTVVEVCLPLPATQ